MNLTLEEIASVVAGLRALEYYLTEGHWPCTQRTEEIIAMANEGGQLTNLAPEDIDELCDRFYTIAPPGQVAEYLKLRRR